MQVGIFLTDQNRVGSDMVSDMPAAQAPDSMRLISDELLPALHRVKTAG